MKTIEEIIVEKEYNELTQEELTLVAELAENEQEYKAMRSLFAQLETEIIPDSRMTASAATKQSLDSIFMAKHPVIAQDWKREEAAAGNGKVIPLYNRMWFRAAAVLLLFSGASYYYYENSTLTGESKKESAQRQVAVSTPYAKEKSTMLDSFEKSEAPVEHTAKRPLTDVAIEDAKAESGDEFTELVYDEPATLKDAEPATASYSWHSSRNEGLNADLYPNGIADKSTTKIASSENYYSSTSDVSTAEMLDWIQTVY